MATNSGFPTHSLDYFSFSRRSPETKNVRSASICNQSPYSDPAVQSPPSDDSLKSLTVSPVSPYILPFSGGAYTLSAEEADINQKVDPSFLGNSTFDDWMLWDSADNTLYPFFKSEPENVKLEPTSPLMETLELSGGVGISPGTRPASNVMDDGSVAFQDSVADEPLFQGPRDTQARANPLYTTSSASWLQTRAAYQETPHMSPYVPLGPNEASRLVVPTSSDPASPQTVPQRADTRRKRKSSSSTASCSSSGSISPNPPPRRHVPVKKTAHNMIEKRYRTNLNDKIAALRDSVPSLRVMEGKLSSGDTVANEDLQGLEMAHKLNKATILSKATEYIAHLETRNGHLSKECQVLKDRIEAFEILLMSQSGPNGQQNKNTHPNPTNFGPRHHNKSQAQKSKWNQQQ